MRKRWALSLIGSLALLCMLGSSAPSLADPFPLQTSIRCDEFGGSTPSGPAAIQPHLQTIPAFTANDVRHYLKTNGFPGAVGTFTILKILFITSREACQRTNGESIGVASDALVCFVEVQGTFYPLLWIGGPVPSSPYAAEIFDARTGDLLVLIS